MTDRVRKIREQMVEVRRNISLKNRIRPLRKTVERIQRTMKRTDDTAQKKKLTIDRNKAVLRISEIQKDVTSSLDVDAPKERMRRLNERLRKAQEAEQ